MSRASRTGESGDRALTGGEPCCTSISRPRRLSCSGSILEAKALDLHHEIAHTDTRQFRQELRGIAVTLEELVAQLDLRLARHQIGEADTAK